MNDAFRGAVIVGATAAFYFGARLSFAYLRNWRRDRRRHIISHVFYLTLALVVTTGLITHAMIDATGENSPLSWVEMSRFVQVILISVGLYPLWVQHRAIKARQAAAPPLQSERLGG